MNAIRLIPVFAVLLCSSLAIAELPTTSDVSYSRDIAPVLKRNCVACHNQSEDEAGVNLESATSIENAEDDDLLIPGKPDASKLFLCASHSIDPIMPPEGNEVSAVNFSALELAKLSQWIAQGAKFDHQSEVDDPVQWQPLPSSMKTVYACVTTTDGRLAAVGFGNRVQIFANDNADPIATLSQIRESMNLPAHEDFVQDLRFHSRGRKIISAGYRNLKFWEMQPPKKSRLPKIQCNRSLGVALSQSGRFLASLSSEGELSVGRVGAMRWDWMRGFDLTKTELSNPDASVFMAVSDTGEEVAAGIGQTIRVVGVNSKTVHELNLNSDLATLCWGDDQTLVSGTSDGTIGIWRYDETQWNGNNHRGAGAAPSSMICTGYGVLVIGVGGEISAWDNASDSLQKMGTLPQGVAACGLAADGKNLIVHTHSGAVGIFRFSDGQISELISKDPVLHANLADDSWKALMADKLAKANAKDLTQAKADVVAEEKSLETIAKELQTKSSDQETKQTAVEDAKRIAVEASHRQDKAKVAQDAATKQRVQLNSAIKKFDATIKDLEQQLETQKQSKANSEKQLAAIPKDEDLASAVKLATEASEKAKKDLASKESELSKVTKSLRSTEKTKALGEKRLEELKAESIRLEKTAEQTKSELAKLKTIEDATKRQVTEEKQAIASVATLTSGRQLVTQSIRSQEWNLWTENGQWLMPFRDLNSDDELICSSDTALLVKTPKDQIKAFTLPTSLWSKVAVIGTSSGDSPFADRVLSIDVSPSGDLIATGGGEPSRSGELMIWNTKDKSLERRIDQSHGDTVLCVKFSPDGKTLASGGADRMIKLWDVATGEMIKTLEGHTHHVTTIDWNLSGRQVASASADATVKIWDVQTGKSTRTISGIKAEITRLVYLGGENRIGITSGDEYFRVYRTDNGSRETNVKLPTGYLYGLDVNRNGTQFVVGGAAGKAVVIDKTGKTLQTLEMND